MTDKAVVRGSPAAPVTTWTPIAPRARVVVTADGELT